MYRLRSLHDLASPIQALIHILLTLFPPHGLLQCLPDCLNSQVSTSQIRVGFTVRSTPNTAKQIQHEYMYGGELDDIR